MNENMMNRSCGVQVEGDSLGRYTAETFGWMFAGLLVTLIVAMGFTMTGTILYIYSLRCQPLALLAAELGVMIYLSTRIEKVPTGTTRSLFSLYAIPNGTILSAHLLAFSLGILRMVSGTATLFFGIMTLIGWFGNISFTKLRSFTLGGLIFLSLCWILTIFIDLSAFDTIVSTVGIFLFLVLTAYDVRRMQAFHTCYSQAPEMAAKASTFPALQLYLDFINLFVYIMRIPGRRRQAGIPGIYLTGYCNYLRDALT